MSRTLAPDVQATDGRSSPRSGSIVAGLLRTARPKQWTKNVLVFAAPGAAGVLTDGDVLVRTVLAFVCFSAAAAGTYFLNDLIDREADRQHPKKCLRPIAAGVVPPRLAAGMAVALLLGSCGGATALGGLDLGGTLAVYVGLTVSYTLWLKQVAVVDLVAVAAGFVVRAVGGGVAAEVPLSDWFLIVTSFSSLFMIAGKRAAEHANLGEARGHTRAILDAYSLPFLRYVRSTSSAVAIGGYCLWAFEKSATSGIPWFELSIAPFVMGILRYALLLETDEGEAPEELVLSDRALQVIGVLWVVLFSFGVYGD